MGSFVQHTQPGVQEVFIGNPSASSRFVNDPAWLLVRPAVRKIRGEDVFVVSQIDQDVVMVSQVAQDVVMVSQVNLDVHVTTQIDRDTPARTQVDDDVRVC